jgi:hypothetical protein
VLRLDRVSTMQGSILFVAILGVRSANSQEIRGALILLDNALILRECLRTASALALHSG